MKKSFKIKIISALLLIAMLLAGCNDPAGTEPPHEHVWADATCSAPKTCKTCSATEGEALAHTWVEATYSAPKTCSVCGLTEGEKLESAIPDKLNLAIQMDKIPIATADMTEEELRDVIVKFMYLQINFAYTPTFSGRLTEYGYYIKNLVYSYGYDDSFITFKEGEYYGGIPYMGNAAGSLYRWLEFYDKDSGQMDWDPILRTARKNWQDSASETGLLYPDVGSAIFGNSCAASCVWSWMRVSNDINAFWTSSWVPKNGLVKVGDYTLANNDTNHGSSTKQICKDNGTQKMFEAYAKIKKADGMVKSGHAIMSVSDAVVVYNQYGKIDGDKSYVLIAEQTNPYLTAAPSKGGTPLYSPLNDKGDTYRIQGNFAGNTVCGKVKEMKYTFTYLYNQGFLPFTIPELCGKAEVEKSEAKLYKVTEIVTDDTIKVSDMIYMQIKSNYAISDIHFNIIDSEGNEVFSAMYAKLGNDVPTLKTYSVADALTKNDLYSNRGIINVNVSEYAEMGGYTLQITARVSTGELLTVYEGKLVK